MALLPWNSEDDNKDNLFQPQPIKKIASVQSGSWQPAASGADSAVATDDVTQGQSQQGGIFGQTPTQQPAQQSSTPYLVSQEKAQVDQAKRQRDAEIEQARIEQEQARQRAEAAAEVSKQFQEGKATDQNGQQFDVEALKNDNGWKKYYDDAFKKEKDSLDFWGRLMDGGQASKRAEVNARLKYNNELLQKAYDDNGNVIDPEAAAYSKKVAAYNSALAQDNSTRSRALGEAIGAFDKPGEDGGFVHRLRNAINAEKQMSIYDAIVGADDSQKTDINDVGRFAGGLVQGIGTMPVIGGKELVEAGTGRGTDEATGFEKDLTAGERIGRGVSGGLNVVTPFIGGSGKLLDSLTTKVLTDTATAAEKTLLKQLTAKILLPAIEQGGIGAAQAGAEYFGNGQTLLDENGEFDKDKLLQFAKETGTAGAMGFGGGALMSGAAMGVNRLRRGNGDLTPVTREEVTPVGTEEVRALQESRAGKSQAEEAIINERLQELKDDGIYYHGTNQKIDEFNEGHLRPTFLTKNKDYAKQYSYDRFNGREGGEAVGSVKTVDFNPSKVLDTSSDEIARALYNDEFLSYIKKFGDDGGVYTPLLEGDKVPYRTADDFYRFMRGKARRGEIDYDAISVRELGDEPDSIIPINPSKAKIRPELHQDTPNYSREDSEISDINRTLKKEALKYKSADDFVKNAHKIMGELKSAGITDSNKAREFWNKARNDNYTPKYIDSESSQRVLNIEVGDNADTWGKWFREQDHSVLETMRNDIESNPSIRDATLSRFYEHYKKISGDNVPFDTFLNREITLYRGGKTRSSNPMVSYTPNKSHAARFGDVHEIKIKPKDTYGMLGDFSEGEVFVPNKVAPQVTKTPKQPTPKVEAPQATAAPKTSELAAKAPDGIATPVTAEAAPIMKEPAARGAVTPVSAEKIPTVQSSDMPANSSVPDGMGTDTAMSSGKLTPTQVAERLMPKLSDNKDVKARIADAAGMGKDTASPLEDILRDGNVNPKRAEKITKHFNDLEEQVQRYNSLEEQNQRAYAEGGTENLDESISRERSRAAREMGTTTRRLMQEIKRMEGGRDHKVALINGLTDIIGTRNANVLTSAGLLERNIFQEITANLKLAAKNPIKMAKSTFMNGNILKDTAKGELSHWGDMPSWKKPVEIVKYVVGNTYRTGMIPTTALANTRRGAVRDELTKWAFQELEGRKVSSKEAHKLSGTAGNEMEALVNTFTGVDNGMTNRKQAMDALKAWKEYIRTGDDGAKAEFLSKVEQHDSLADQMIAGLSKEDQVRARGLMALKNLIFPFVRTATNLAKNTVRQDLNPFARSLLDEIRVDQRSGGANTINLIKSKLVDYGIMSGAAALASSGAIVYNDGDEVDKPKGWSLKIGDNEYIPVRATSLELPIAMAGAAQAMASDIAEGKPQDWKHYAGMITGSLPYIDQFNQTTGAVDSLAGMGDENGDQGYAAKSYAVNTIKSFVPGSNNGVQAYVAGKQGESLNAKTVYDKNFGTWLQNSIQKSYDPEFYNGLKDSRDNAGRVRTVDNQGVISNKTINDAPTAEFNQRITDLVDYGRKAGLGKNTQDMFNTYDTGKNNNFKSIQDSITFLDVPDGGKPDNTKKLEKNEKLTNLSQQMRDGFFGDSGNELLTLDGKNLYSDVSVPNGAGSKNSRLPISMASIRNAVAQTDLPAGDRERMKQISDQDSALYDQLKAKQITYEQYTAEKAKTGAEYQRILSNSPSYQKMLDLFDELDSTGFFEANGLGSTKSGQTYLWNSLNALLGSKGATPAANFPDTSKGWTPWNRGTGRTSNSGGNLEGGKGVQFTPVTARQLAAVKAAQFTPFKVKVKLGNEIKRDRSQNYSDRSF